MAARPPGEGQQDREQPRSFTQGRVSVPPGACELLLIRHGESEAAVEGAAIVALDGHANPPLSKVGRVQAERLASRLGDERVDAIYVSSLLRTAQTAEPLAERLRIRPVVEHDLRELFLGEWEGWVLEQKLADRDPHALRVLREQRWDLVPGVEPLEGFRERVRGAIERVASNHPDQRVAVVTHGATIAEVLSQATGSRPFAFLGADNASISHLVVTPQRWILRRYNDTTHVDRHFSIRAAAPL